MSEQLHSPPPGTRINVVGSTGSGKTTTGRALAARLGLPFIEMDALFWQPNWGQTDDESFRAKVEAATRGDRWVIDGNYSRNRDIVWSRADTLIWLDYSFGRTLWQLLRRTVRRSFTGEELWHGNRETFARSLLSPSSIIVWLLRTYWRRRRNYTTLLASSKVRHLAVIHLRSPEELAQWMGRLPSPDKGTGP